MSRQVVNTDKISVSVNKLHIVDSNINEEFETLERKAKQLDNNWKSIAGDTAGTRMYRIFKNNEMRSAVLQNYINMLKDQINPNYTNTESTNVRLADKFK